MKLPAALLLALLAAFALARYMRRNGWIYVSCYRPKYRLFEQ